MDEILKRPSRPPSKAGDLEGVRAATKEIAGTHRRVAKPKSEPKMEEPKGLVPRTEWLEENPGTRPTK
jgi:hypothetical protein